MLDDRKRQEILKVSLTEREFHEFYRLCARDDRSPAEYAHLILRKFLFGNSVPSGELLEGSHSTRESQQAAE